MVRKENYFVVKAHYYVSTNRKYNTELSRSMYSLRIVRRFGPWTFFSHKTAWSNMARQKHLTIRSEYILRESSILYLRELFCNEHCLVTPMPATVTVNFVLAILLRVDKDTCIYMILQVSFNIFMVLPIHVWLTTCNSMCVTVCCGLFFIVSWSKEQKIRVIYTSTLYIHVHELSFLCKIANYMPRNQLLTVYWSNEIQLYTHGKLNINLLLSCIKAAKCTSISLVVDLASGKVHWN